MLAIRLTRKGAKKKPFYRVVVVEKSAPRDGRFIEIVGHYDPMPAQAVFKLDIDRVNYWIGKGAQPSDTVKSLVARSAPAPELTS